MTARKDLRTRESEYRSTDHSSRQQRRAEVGSKFWHHLLLGVALFGIAMLGITSIARAQDFESMQVLEDRGWHGVGGTMQAQATTVDPRALPIVAVWTREPIDGDWLYVKFLIGCDQGLMVAYAMIDDTGRIRLARHILGYTPPALAPVPGSDKHRIMRGVCNNYGFAP